MTAELNKKTFVIPPEDWERTPASVQKLVQELLTYLASAKGEVAPSPGTADGNGNIPSCSSSRDRLVVFISDLPRAREAKLALGLRELGWRVILLHKTKPTFDPAVYVDEAYGYAKPEQAVAMARHFQADVFHVFSNWNFDVAEALISRRPGPVIFDDFDVLAGMLDDDFLNTYYPGQVEKEKFCLEHADGICCRSIETQYLKRKLGYRFQGPRIFFPEYSWGDAIARRPLRDDPTHRSIVYIGNLLPSDGSEPKENSWVRRLERALKKQGFVLHLFPSRPDYRPPKSMDKSPALRFHVSQEQTRLIDIMTSFTGGFQIPISLKNSEKSHYTKNKGRHSIAGKVFDYLDAGLPTVLADQYFQAWLLGRYGAAIRLDPAQPLKSLASLDPERLATQRQTLRERDLGHLHLRNQVPRLARFYEHVVSSAAAPSLRTAELEKGILS